MSINFSENVFNRFFLAFAEKFVYLMSRIGPIRMSMAKSLWRDYPELVTDKLFHKNLLSYMAKAVEFSPELITDIFRDEKFCVAFMSAFSKRWHDSEIPLSVLELVHHATQMSMSYGQEGEDIILLRLLDITKNGFYVDIGAHHPIRFSNTYALYKAGWCGLNVDATPGSMEIFRTVRPRDINVEGAVSDKVRPMLFHVFEEGALNTFDEVLAAGYVNLGWKLLRTQQITPCSLATLFAEHLPAGQTIDLMSLDVEGEELGVLASNDWDRYRPRTIVLEVLDTSLAQLEAAPTVKFLREKGYVPVAKLLNSTIMQLEA